MFNYTTQSVAGLETILGTSAKSGLTSGAIMQLQKKWGLNTLEQLLPSWVAILARQVRSPFNYLLLFAAIVFLFLHDYTNAIIITIILLINTFLSFFQEYRAERVLLSLKKHLKISCKVVRSGKEEVIDGIDLVPGDLIMLKAGDYIPADVRFISASGVVVDESVLTGESAPVAKVAAPLSSEPTDVYHATNLGFLGTALVAGHAQALVVNTGKNTIFGALGQLTLQAMRQSSFAQRIGQLSTFLVRILVLTLIIFFLAQLAIKYPAVSLSELFLFAVALTIGLTPEAFPVVTTFALSRGALRLSRHDVIVKRLSSIEELGSVTVLCSDKTGTLTENKLVYVESCALGSEQQLMLYALLASTEKKGAQGFDSALNVAVSDDIKKESALFEAIDEIPFDPQRLSNAVLVKNNNEYILIVRGAFEAVVSKSKKDYDVEKLTKWMNEQSAQANRVLAVAFKKLEDPKEWECQEHDLTFLGLLAFNDPLKPDAKQAIEKARKLGVQIKMLTGDSKEVAAAVSMAIGLIDDPAKVLLGAEFEKLDANQKLVAVREYAVFARVVPEQKYEIVSLLQQNEIVGFLGEGINDAPSLKEAHVGLVVKGASDIATDAADIVLLKKDLKVIIDGIWIGRTTFSNIIKYIIVTISSNFGNFFSIALASLFLKHLPMLPIQILLVNLLSDVQMILIATDRVDIDELKKPPVYDIKHISFAIMLFALINSASDFVFFSLFSGYPPQVLQTNWFIESLWTELVLIFSLRTKKVFFKAARPSFGLVVLSGICFALSLILPYSVFGQRFFHFSPPSMHHLVVITGIVVGFFISNEIVKRFYYAFNNHKH